jgi:transposase
VPALAGAPRPIRQLRDLTRYRRALIQDRTREMQRVEKLLEDAQIKLSSVASNVFGVSGRAMLEALIAGQRDPKVLAQLARRRLRVKLAALEEALSGFFTDHHGAILRVMLDNIDRHSEQIAALDRKVEEAIAPFAVQVAQLDQVTGVGATAAQELIAEVGVDMARFPSAAHLVSWAKFCPQVHESAGKHKPKGRGKGNPWLAGTLGNIVATAARTDSFLGARYRRIAKRRGKQKAIVATGNSVLVIVYHLLVDPTACFIDLGADHYQSRINHDRRARSLASQLQAVTGQRIIVRNGKAVIIEPDAA